MISLDAKTRNVPQFLGAPQQNFETTDLGIESSVPLALGGRVNPSDTLVPSTETIHRPRPPRTEESPRFSKCVLRSIFRGSKLRAREGYRWTIECYRIVMLRPKITYLIFERSHSVWIRHNDLARCQNSQCASVHRCTTT